MKVIKRDGRAVDYDREKIRIAIEKANKEVNEEINKAGKEDIKKIMDYIEGLGKKRILVEDVQDIIEKKLMEMERYELAKKYIVYRYTRALVRKQNTTDETILGLIRNENNLDTTNNSQRMLTAIAQRNYIAGEVSKDLTRRMLLPEKISKAHDEGILYFHNSDYFVQPIINSCFIRLGDILKNGTVINEQKIDKPNNFLSACEVTKQIIAATSSNQYGIQYIDLIYLGEFLKNSEEKYQKELEEKYENKISKEVIKKLVQDRLKEELKLGVQQLLYQINIIITSNGQAPKVVLFLHLEENDKFIKQNAQIIEEIKKQKSMYEQKEFPKLVYDLTECEVKEEGKFSQGVVSINLPQIALTIEGIEKRFWELLEERLEICKEALMCRYYALLGTKSDISPIHWQHGALARLKKGEKIDELLNVENSSVSLGIVGVKEMVKILTGEDLDTQKGQVIVNKLKKLLKSKIENWKKENNLEFNLCTNPEECAIRYFVKIDKEKFGTIKEITDKGWYSNI